MNAPTDAPTVLVSRRGQVAVLTLNRPDRLNAVSEQLYRALLDALVTADDDPQVRCVLLTGAGRAFCVGADLKAHAAGTRTRAERENYVLLGQEVCRQLQTMSTPVVAAVHGYALGAGAELAVSADFLVIADDARMGFPEVSIGTFVGGGVTHRLPRLLGLRRATDLLILGERFTGAEAFDWGLAHAAVPADDLLDAAAALADSLSTKAPLALARMKAALRRDDPLHIALDSEPRDLLALMETEDWAEGVAAFAERRDPVFRGR
ncbi:enoyl-CoA hydratase/isomerase family protein [Nocardia blacklockiae]|uniref:enoyl-CoA hydratase/isomerase family protein n=1 Tax=Nocardia blacklockiae TaxID=480036 RepID=UPI001894D311|nr:enoyl-CoA hydratase/isomerase family protein [Nocardia blacklockiae]MBF6171337.1 enoyl-CoA hydratase/isomerase family protein [Nocardia blacklockiae]